MNDDWFEPPKIKLNFESCYNYQKLKSEGYISPTEVPPELLEVPTSNNSGGTSVGEI